MRKLILTFCIVLASASAVFTQTTLPVTPLDKARAITLDTPNGWGIGIRPDGSVSLGYGAGPTLSGEAPAGSISFSDVYKSVVPLLSAEGTISSDIDVVVDDTQSSQKVAYYLHDRTVMRRIMATLRGRMKPSHEHNAFERKMRERPPEAD